MKSQTAKSSPSNPAAEAAASSLLDKLLPDYQIADWRHELFLADELAGDKADFQRKILERIEKDAMLPYYKTICRDLSIPEDAALLQKLEAANVEEMEGLLAKIEDAKENYGDSEVRDALLRKAQFYCRIGDKEKAVEAYNVAFDKTVGSGGRLDTILTLTRIGFFFGDTAIVKRNIQLANAELEKGGDWERRNKLKVYEGILMMICRSFKEAAERHLDSVATFTANELLSFESFIFYTVITSMLAVDRPTLRTKVINSPEVLQILGGDEHLRGFVNCLYSGKYREFMSHLVVIAARVRRDRYLGRHYRYFIRNIRLRAYSQFLEPYKSVTLSSMADSFGVSEKFIEDEVASFIASGQLNCKIDKVKGVIESNQPDQRNALYLQSLKQGDMLLNRIQKLSRVIDM